jgi:hypothetical protein
MVLKFGYCQGFFSILYPQEFLNKTVAGHERICSFTFLNVGLIFISSLLIRTVLRPANSITVRHRFPRSWS